MRILDWECTINHDGMVRAAVHAENGSIAWINGRIVGYCDAPAAVVEWLMRPRLRSTWRAAFDQGHTFHLMHTNPVVFGKCSMPPNPYEGEPPNKDNEPS